MQDLGGDRGHNTRVHADNHVRIHHALTGPVLIYLARQVSGTAIVFFLSKSILKP